MVVRWLHGGKHFVEAYGSINVFVFPKKGTIMTNTALYIKWAAKIILTPA
jgi:hypothetical protein